MADVLVQLGSMAGAAAATFGTLWLTFIRGMKEEIREAKTAADTPAVDEALSEKVHQLEAKLASLETKSSVLESNGKRASDDIQNQAARIDRFQERLSQCVTTDEFQTHAQYTADNLNALVDRVGRAVGALDAWSGQGRR